MAQTWSQATRTEADRSGGSDAPGSSAAGAAGGSVSNGGDGTDASLGGASAGSGATGGSEASGATGGAGASGSTATEGGFSGAFNAECLATLDTYAADGGYDSGACSPTWWGGTLDGVKGLLECPPPCDPALLAYGQTQLPSCESVTGPTGSDRQGDALSCCYHYDERGCGNDWQADSCMALPYFGDGTTTVQIPQTASTTALAGCGNPRGAEIVPATLLERANLLLGVWLFCSAAPTPFQGTAIAFRANGTFESLIPDSTGHWVRSPGCYQTGLWGFRPDYPVQLNLYANDHGLIQLVSFYQGPPYRAVFFIGGLGEVELVPVQ